MTLMFLVNVFVCSSRCPAVMQSKSLGTDFKNCLKNLARNWIRIRRPKCLGSNPIGGLFPPILIHVTTFRYNIMLQIYGNMLPKAQLNTFCVDRGQETTASCGFTDDDFSEASKRSTLAGH
ncbi:hypothetical protein TNCV_3407991 [Trichonephila clavipes]|nr:hypothetical protein TNCV_3407991 [Trichonephila clavipes]